MPLFINPFRFVWDMIQLPKEALDFTLSLEGGWYPGDEARDRHPTMKGVTQGRYDMYRDDSGEPRQSVRLISRPELESIYSEYWVEAYGPHLPRLTAITMFDHAVNSGAEDAIRCFQHALGLTADGIVGPKTTKAIRSVGVDDRRVAELVTWERLTEYYDLALKSQRLRPNLTSWVGRIVRFRERYLLPET